LSESAADLAVAFLLAFLAAGVAAFFAGGCGSESVECPRFLRLRRLRWDGAEDASESDELESLPEDEEELDEDPELLLELADSELVPACGCDFELTPAIRADFRLHLPFCDSSRRFYAVKNFSTRAFGSKYRLFYR
jgi:hypothetical protein